MIASWHTIQLWRRVGQASILPSCPSIPPGGGGDGDALWGDILPPVAPAVLGAASQVGSGYPICFVLHLAWLQIGYWLRYRYQSRRYRWHQ